MKMRVQGFLVVTTIGGLIACGGALEIGEARPSSSEMRVALNCPNCPTAHKIEQDNDPSGCSVGETCNPPSGGATKISCVDADTSHDGNTCNGVIATAN